MKRLLLAGATLGVSSAAFAEDSAVTTALNAAISAGQANYGLVVVGVIGMAAVGFGMYAIVGAMRN
ncbi:hypothetical protein EK599_15120 [Vibrio sp. T187]|uniref:hypothetical protein n=1 Tax=Vibrio TaxID=662 RepID=UPI0010C9ED86|nr:MULTISPECIES: hypothetical protein [Vibrio]MBW3697031.1 hypothetical protein [Vibrio sp. T187]